MKTCQTLDFRPCSTRCGTGRLLHSCEMGHREDIEILARRRQREGLLYFIRGNDWSWSCTDEMISEAMKNCRFRREAHPQRRG